MHSSHSTVVRLIANLDRQPSQFCARDQELIVSTALERAIASLGEMKSEPFRAGAKATLAWQLVGRQMPPPPYPEGSVYRDAWLSGKHYGKQIARIIHDSGWSLFLEATAETHQRRMENPHANQ